MSDTTITQPERTGVITINLAPAQWIWFPSRRTLPNTFVLFRRELTLAQAVRRATGWVCADSRYTLEVNGQRWQFGPAPADPRWLEADPLDLSDQLVVGNNVIAATVLFYGQGDGTSPLGKPGFIFRLEIELLDGTTHTVISDHSWHTQVCRAWPPGQYKRWYVRALQEEFNARAYPHGWNQSGYAPDARWLHAMPLDCPADTSPTGAYYPDHLFDAHSDPNDAGLLERSVPMLHEAIVNGAILAEACMLHWQVPPEDYFAFDIPDAVRAGERVLLDDAAQGIQHQPHGPWTLPLEPDQSVALTFAFPYQFVGWPIIELEASAGTIIELIVHEAHAVGGPVLLNTHFHSWSRLICRDGNNRFEPFDFECFRWLQLVIRNASGPVTVRNVNARKRSYPFQRPQLETNEPALNVLFAATFNTAYNSLQEVPVDGMGRERQQYSGDCGHQLHVARLAFGDTALSRRHFLTYMHGQVLEGYFLDCWPAYDRLVRVSQRQLNLTPWGPILDHAIGFVQDAHHHFLFSGDFGVLEVLLPRFERLLAYFERSVLDGLLPVQDLGVPMVWIDHEAYLAQHHKQCAYNLYAAAMLEQALTPLAQAARRHDVASRASRLGQQLRESCIERFWDDAQGVFVINRPWLPLESEQRHGPRLCDRSLATAILYGQCPNNRTEPSLNALEHVPPELGFSYPANAVWRLWALAHGGRIEAVLDDLRTRWATLPSVTLNNTVPEFWNVTPDSHAQWSHCATAPLNVMYANVAGIRPTAPGFTSCDIRPQPGSLEQLRLTAHTPHGPIHLSSTGATGARELQLEIPEGITATLVLPHAEDIALEAIQSTDAPVRYRLGAGRTTFHLKHL